MKKKQSCNILVKLACFSYKNKMKQLYKSDQENEWITSFSFIEDEKI